MRRPDKVDPLDLSLACPFYVGKGCNGRLKDHRREAESLKGKPGRKSIKIAIIHKLWKQGLDFKEDIFINNYSEEDALAIEIAAIEQYGRIDLGTGCLANLTNGGEGTSGYTPWNKGKTAASEESIERARQLNLGRIRSSETKDRLKQSHLGQPSGFKGKHHKEESKEKLRKARLKQADPRIGKNHTEESKLEISRSRKGKCTGEDNPNWQGRAYTEERRKNDSERMSGENNPNYGKHPAEETIEKIRIGNIGQKRSDETKEKLRQVRLGKKDSPETIEKRKESSRITWKFKRWDKIIGELSWI